MIVKKISEILSPELYQEGEWVNAKFTSKDGMYEERYYIVDGKIQTWQQAKRLKAKRLPLKK